MMLGMNSSIQLWIKLRKLANIVNDKLGRKPRARPKTRTTLIVTTTSTVTQCKDHLHIISLTFADEPGSNEIIRHCHKDYAGNVLLYRSGCKLNSHNLEKSLQEFDIMYVSTITGGDRLIWPYSRITTYNEVMRSYPAIDPPSDLKSLNEKTDWWKCNFEQNRGVLHRIYFRRIVLDEAAIIKNYAGRISTAW